MNIYILTTTINTFLAADLIIRETPVKGLITLSPENAIQSKEYYCYKQFCQEHQLEYIEIEDYSLKNDREKLKNLKIDLLIVVGWQRLIPQWLIDLCSIGAIGGHGSPWGIRAGRGRSPQNWALILGEKKFEMSIFWINNDADSGEIIDTTIYYFNESDDIDISYIKYSYEFAKLITKNLRNGNIFRKYGIKQEGDTFYLPKRIQSDGAIDWNRSCKQIYNFVRALSRPYPGAFCKNGEKKLTIWDVKYYETAHKEQLEPGRVIAILPNKDFLVSCLNGIIIVRDYEKEEGFPLEPGFMLESVNYNKQMEIIVKRHYEGGGGRLNSNILSQI